MKPIVSRSVCLEQTRAPMRRRLWPLAVISAALMLCTVLGNPMVRADRTSITKTITVPEFGVSVSFGLSLDYAPKEALARLGGRVPLSYAPGPLPITMSVNVLTLLEANGMVTSMAAELLNQTVGGIISWTVSIPISAGTPVGSQTVQSVTIFSQGEFGAYLDVTLNGQVNATLTATAGTIDPAQLTMRRWGGYEANFTAPQTAGTATVTASFSYYVTNGYKVRFEPASVISLILGQSEYTIYEFPLGAFPFGNAVQSRIEVVDTSAQSSEQSSPLLPIAGSLVVGLVVGAAVGLVIGRRKRATRPKEGP